MSRTSWIYRMTTCGVLGAVTIAVWGSSATLSGQEPARVKRSLTLADYYRLQTVGDPAISPDGKLIAFVRTSIVESENRRHSEIWLVLADGASPPRRLSHPSFSSSSPRWSPDGTLLAFSSRRKLPGQKSEDDESPLIWFLRMDAGGGEAFQIEGVAGTPVFSPDNKWIAFTKKTPPGPKSPARYDSEFERLIHERFKGRIFDWMQFRFDGRGYLPDPRDPRATPPEEIYIVQREGGVPKQLTRLGVRVQSMAWRSDSGALAIVADDHERDEHSYERADLWIVDLEGQIRRMTDDGYDYSDPVWSPDGTFIGFRRVQGLDLIIRARQDHGSPVDLYRMPAAGGALENLTGEWDLIPGAPRWSPDGQALTFSAGVGGSSHLFTLAVGTKAVRQVTQGDRRLSGISVSSSAAGAGRVAYAAADPTHPAEIFTARIDGTDERRLSRFNDELIDAVALSRAERIRYPSKDGTDIEGWVLTPGECQSSQRCPLILAIHGGPHGAYGNDFSFQFQLWAANGYAVLFTNPRGSTGYGEKFLWATWGGWGILDYDDVMAGVDYVVKRYPIDQRRMGVTGYSYGGFLTNWVIGHTTRFVAAISGAGIANWISDYGTADIPRTKETEFYGTPWDTQSAELMMRLSPVIYAGNVATPTLFIHGESDARVPIAEAEQMYTALKKRRVAAKFVRYPDSYHGGWSPWNMMHRYDQELKWWRMYFQTPTSSQ